MRSWRISNYADLSGIGGKYKAGRWNLLGTPIVYCAEHPALAMLEMLVHFDADDLPETYQLLEIDVPDSLASSPPSLPDGWRDDEQVTRDQFEAFCRQTKWPVMTVPSVIMQHSFNHLINPRHPDVGLITTKSVVQYPLDPRFLR